jgi:hypothetical protein
VVVEIAGIVAISIERVVALQPSHRYIARYLSESRKAKKE